MKRITIQKLLVIVFMFFSLTAFSKEENSDFATVIEAIKTTKSIQIKAVSPMVYVTRYDLNYEDEINTRGAKYIFEETADIAKIINMFLLSKPSSEKQLPNGFIHPNIALYFILSNGQEVKFLLENQYSKEDPLVYGKYSSTNNLSANACSVSSDLKMNIYKYLSNSEKNMNQKYPTSFQSESWRSYMQSVRE